MAAVSQNLGVILLSIVSSRFCILTLPFLSEDNISIIWVWLASMCDTFLVFSAWLGSMCSILAWIISNFFVFSAWLGVMCSFLAWQASRSCFILISVESISSNLTLLLVWNADNLVSVVSVSELILIMVFYQFIHIMLKSHLIVFILLLMS